MEKNWQYWISRSAAFLYKGESSSALPYDRISKAAYLLLFSITFCILAATMSHEYSIWKQVYPAYPVDRAEWNARVLPERLACAGASCPTKVTNSFWNSAKSLEDSGVKSLLREGRAGEVWLGLRISSDRLGEIISHESDYLVLGWIKGSYSLWINGELLQRISDEDYGPEAFAIPDSLLRRERELSVVIRLEPRTGARNLVPFTAGMKEGFGDFSTARAFRSFHMFTGSAKPLALFLVYFVLSVIFFLLWVASPKNREYFHLSAFTLVCSLPNLFFSDAFSFHFAPDFSMRLYILIVFAKAATALNLGLSFSRSRHRIVARSSFAVFAVALALITFCPVTMLSLMRKPLNQQLIALAYFCGASSCLIQAWALSIRKKDGFSFRFRQRKLFQFSAILGTLAVIQFVQYGNFFSTIEADVFWDMPEVVLALFLGFIALSDYRTQYEMVEKTPISPYHRRPDLPESVAGVLMMLDLKNSERIFRSSLGESDPFQMPSIISTIWTAIAEIGGVVIKAEGDEVIAFFDQDQNTNPLVSALRAADLCSERLERLSMQGTRYVPSLAFRAGVAYGTIRPIWVGEGGDRLPSWTQTGGSMVFLECSRLMEAEKSIGAEKAGGGSLTLLPHELLQRFELESGRLEGEVVLRAERVRGKHDRIYSVTCYRPGRRFAARHEAG